jgi:hypothetical protein
MSAQDNPFSALRDAARARRAAEHDDASWVARAAGRLSPGDEAALEARAESDPVAAHMRAVTAPATGAEQGELEASVLAALGERGPARVVQLAPRRQRVIALSAAVLAAAAAILLIVRAPSEPQRLPTYEGSLSGSDVAVRSATPALSAPRARVSPGALVTLTAQPVDVLPQGVEPAARLFVLQGASVALLDVPIELAPSGALRITAPYARLFGARRGELDLVLFVGLPAALPDTDTALARVEAPGTGLQVLRFPLSL